MSWRVREEKPLGCPESQTGPDSRCLRRAVQTKCDEAICFAKLVLEKTFVGMQENVSRIPVGQQGLLFALPCGEAMSRSAAFPSELDLCGCIHGADSGADSMRVPVRVVSLLALLAMSVTTAFGQKKSFPGVEERNADFLAEQQRANKTIQQRVGTLEEQMFVTRARIKRNGKNAFPGVVETSAASLAAQQAMNKSLQQRVETLEEQVFVTRARIAKSGGGMAFPGVEEANAANLAAQQRMNKTLEERVSTLEVQTFVTRSRITDGGSEPGVGAELGTRSKGFPSRWDYQGNPNPGYFLRDGNTWREYQSNGTLIATFRHLEQGADHVLLHDDSRGMTLKLTDSQVLMKNGGEWTLIYYRQQ